MTITEAIEIIARDVKVFARKNEIPVTLTLVEERTSEWMSSDSIKGTAARILAGEGHRQKRALRLAREQ